MFLQLFILPIFSFFFAAGALADQGDWQNYIPIRQSLIGVGIFDGDQHGDFKNDIVAYLGDGSAWKVHPTESEIFSQWNINDVVHVGVRTSYYYFKREHKFELVNHSRNETVKAMLVQHSVEPPLTLVFAEIYLENSTVIPYTSYDHQGRPQTNYTISNSYAKKITLSDGSIWVLRNGYNEFFIGDRIYVGVNASKSGFNFFLIKGSEREAIWTWAHKK